MPAALIYLNARGAVREVRDAALGVVLIGGAVVVAVAVGGIVVVVVVVAAAAVAILVVEVACLFTFVPLS